MKTKFKWVKIGETTERACVPSGWIVKETIDTWSGHSRAKVVSMVFVPDPNHEWEMDR